MKLVFASNNQHKLEEVRQILPTNIMVISLKEIGFLQDIDETGISAPATKAYPATYQGFRLEKGLDYYYLAFGEFDGGSEYDEEDIMIQWPDGSINVITYTRKLNNTTVSAKQTFKLDGVKCSNPIVIVK